GKTLAIFGPNGAGKTTLIKILASIMKPSAGEVFVNGLDLNNNGEDVRSQIGIVSHQTFLYSNLTAYENLLFYSRMYDVADFKQRIYQVVSMVGMQSRLHDRIGTLSRGMQQRLSIARCLLHKPPIILLDEPETGLDQQAISMLWGALKEDGTIKRTIIFTSHNLERGLNACDTLIILNKGKITHQQPSEDLDLAGLKKAYQDCTGAGNENTE
ncbi:MAG: ABC transporter ATP-binding protein, partial [Dehalococcoidales bacterium]|nr:ABC transporter ATP-binding protein [Dehalococcoidales bacterium]